MTRLAITGHRGLPADTGRLVDAALRGEISKRAGRGLVGLSCLADGADTLFARAVLDVGGELVAIVPAERYWSPCGTANPHAATAAPPTW